MHTGKWHIPYKHITKIVMDTLLERISSILCGGGCFNAFSVTFDGVPCWGKCYLLGNKRVASNWDINKILIIWKKMDSLKLGNHVVDAIVNNIGLQLEN